MTSFSFQGISDRVAQSYIDAHGNASWSAIQQGLASRPPCPLLKNFWAYDGCRYDKLSGCCSEPEHVSSCPVPKHRLRNGRLNQTAYSLFLFMRDIAKNDFAAWLDTRIAEARGQYSGHAHFEEALVVPMRGIYGVSDRRHQRRSPTRLQSFCMCSAKAMVVNREALASPKLNHLR